MLVITVADSCVVYSMSVDFLLVEQMYYECGIFSLSLCVCLKNRVGLLVKSLQELCWQNSRMIFIISIIKWK